MKKIFFSLLLLIGVALTANAQSTMAIKLIDGSVLNLYTSQIEEVLFDMDTDGPGENDPGQNTVTGNATDIDFYSATINAYANNIMDSEATDLRVGIIYCTTGTPNKSNGTQKTVSLSSIASDGKYSIRLTGLSESTLYYYRSFVYQSGLWFYGKVKEFRTKSWEDNITFQTGAYSNVTCFSANVSAQMKVAGSYGSLSYGICYGTTAEPTTKVAATSKDASGNYSVQLRALAGNTVYYYRPYAVVDGNTHYGQSSSFRTRVDDVVETGVADDEWNVRSQLTLSGGAFSKLEVGVCYAKGSELPTVADNKASTIELDDDNYFEVKMTPSAAGTYRYRAYVLIDGSEHYGAVKDKYFEKPSMSESHAVDLGLPSGTKWADMNVGAEKPEDYGSYFAWGETEEKVFYDWSTYKWCKGSSDTMTKYCTSSSYGTVDNKTVLDPEDDAATVNWGGNWRMPTDAERMELYSKCSWTWTTQNGVYGRKVTGPSRKSIFLPAAGYRNDSSRYNAGSCGYFWSSSLYRSDSNHAYYLYFYSSAVDMMSRSRYGGLSVRAVCP